MTASTFPVPNPLDRLAVAEDWDVLLSAVAAKLRLLLGEPPVPPDAMAPLRAGVLECAAALDQIVLLIKEQWPLLAPGSPPRERGEAA